MAMWDPSRDAGWQEQTVAVCSPQKCVLCETLWREELWSNCSMDEVLLMIRSL